LRNRSRNASSASSPEKNKRTSCDGGHIAKRKSCDDGHIAQGVNVRWFRHLRHLKGAQS
jgi:hypothetical protein